MIQSGSNDPICGSNAPISSGSFELNPVSHDHISSTFEIIVALNDNF